MRKDQAIQHYSFAKNPAPKDKNFYTINQKKLRLDISTIMSKAVKKSLSELRKYIKSTASRAQKMVAGTGAPGTRAAPAQTGKNDSSIGCRIDFGDPFTKDGKTYQRLKFQLNKNAEDSTIRKAVQADGSHKVWAHADVEVVPNADPKTALRLVDNALDEMEGKL